jgi:hypothetical protein
MMHLFGLASGLTSNVGLSSSDSHSKLDDVDSRIASNSRTIYSDAQDMGWLEAMAKTGHIKK